MSAKRSATDSTVTKSKHARISDDVATDDDDDTGVVTASTAGGATGAAGGDTHPPHGSQTSDVDGDGVASAGVLPVSTGTAIPYTAPPTDFSFVAQPMVTWENKYVTVQTIPGVQIFIVLKDSTLEMLSKRPQDRIGTFMAGIIPVILDADVYGAGKTAMTWVHAMRKALVDVTTLVQANEPGVAEPKSGYVTGTVQLGFGQLGVGEHGFLGYFSTRQQSNFGQRRGPGASGGGGVVQNVFMTRCASFYRFTATVAPPPGTLFVPRSVMIGNPTRQPMMGQSA